MSDESCFVPAEDVGEVLKLYLAAAFCARLPPGPVTKFFHPHIDHTGSGTKDSVRQIHLGIGHYNRFPRSQEGHGGTLAFRNGEQDA